MIWHHDDLIPLLIPSTHHIFAVPLGCVLRHTSFYHTVLFKAVAPFVAVALLWCYPLGMRLLLGRSTKSTMITVKRLSLLLIEIVLPSIATSLVQVCLRDCACVCVFGHCSYGASRRQVFVCDSFDGKASFLRAQLTIHCDGSDGRARWVSFAAVALAVYVLGGASNFLSYLSSTRHSDICLGALRAQSRC